MAVNVFELFGQIGAKDNASKVIDNVVGKAKEADRTLSKTLNSIGSGATKVGSKLTSFITKPAVGAASALTGITLVKGFGRLVGIDTAKAKLKGLGHDAKSVENIMNSALESVKGTSHGMDEAATTAAGAVAAGVEPGKELTRYLTLTGDAAAIAGTSMAEMGSIINKVQTGQKAYTENLEQLADRGLPIYQWLGEEAGVAADQVKELASDGQISSDMFLAAIEKNIGGAAKIMGESSFSAAAKNIGASIGRIGANFLDAGGKGGGFFSKLKPLMSDLMVRLEKVEGIAAELGEKFGESFQTAIDFVTKLIEKFDAMSPAAQSATLKSIGIGSAVAVGIGPALSIFGQFTGALGSVAEKVETFNNFMGGIPSGITNFVKESSVISDFGSTFETMTGKVKGSKLGETFTSMGNKVNIFGDKLSFLKGPFAKVSSLATGTASTVTSSLTGLMGIVLKMIGPAAIIGVLIAGLGLVQSQFGDQINQMADMTIQRGPEIIKNLGDGIAIKIPYFIQQGTELIRNFLMVIQANLPQLLQSGTQILMSLINGVATYLPQLIPLVIQIFGTLIENIILNLPLLLQAGLSLLMSLIQGVMDNLPMLIQTVVSLVTTLITVIGENLPMILQTGIEILFAIISGLVGAIPDLLAALPQIFSAITGAFGKVDWKKLGIDILNGVIKGIKDTLGNLGKVVKNVAGSVKNWFAEKLGIHSPSTVMAEQGGYVVDGVEQGINGKQNNVKTAIGSITGAISNAFSGISQKVDLVGASQSGVNIANAMVNGVKQSLANLPTVGATYLNRFIQSFSGKGSLLTMSGMQMGQGLILGLRISLSMLPTVGTIYMTQFIATMRSKTGQGKAIGNQIGLSFVSGVSSSSGSLNSAAASLMNLFTAAINRYGSKLRAIGILLIQLLIAGITSMQTLLLNKATQLAQSITKSFEKQGSAMRNAGADLIKKLAQGITSAKSAVETAVRGISGAMLNGIKKGIDGVIGGVNFVLNEVGSTTKLKTWTLPKYAKGTDGHPEDGPAIVNDGKGRHYQELYQEPNGRFGLFPRVRNLMVNMKKGTKVLSGSATAKLNNAPRYETGIGFNEDIFDYLDKPKELLDKVIGSKIDYKGVVNPWLDMTKSAVAKMTGAAVPLVQKEFDSLASSGGDISDTSKDSNGVFSYLMAIARKLMAKYNMVFTSGYRPGDPYDHGKGLAVDIALPGVTNGSPTYKKAADEAIRMAGVKYVITNGMWKHKGQPWVTWPDGDHYDHVHISGEKPTRQTGAGGSGVSRWRNTVLQALSKNKLPTSASYVNAWLRQIQTESGGNEKAIGGNDGLADGNAMGLVQVKPGTFNAYKHKGYNQILRGLDNLLAGINYAKNRYGSSGMLGVIGQGHGYANGGFPNKHQVAEISEGNRLEAIIPLSKTRRAWEIISQSIGYLVSRGSFPSSFAGQDVNTRDLSAGMLLTSESSNTTNQNDTTELLALFKEFVELFKSGAFGVSIGTERFSMVTAESNDKQSGKRVFLSGRGIIV